MVWTKTKLNMRLRFHPKELCEQEKMGKLRNKFEFADLIHKIGRDYVQKGKKPNRSPGLDVPGK